VVLNENDAVFAEYDVVLGVVDGVIVLYCGAAAARNERRKG
jgi:hypothetical protein